MLCNNFYIYKAIIILFFVYNLMGISFFNSCNIFFYIYFYIVDIGKCFCIFYIVFYFCFILIFEIFNL